MDVKGKVEHRSPLRQLANISIWGKDKYLTRCRLGVKTLGDILLSLVHQLAQTL